MSLRSLLALPLFAAASFGADIQTLSGKKLSGEVVGLDKQSVILKTADGEVRHPLADVLQISTNAADSPAATAWTDIELTDGSILRCGKIEFGPQTLNVVLTNEQLLKIPYTTISTLCRDAQDAKLKAEFQQFAAKRGRFDLVAIRSEGRLNALEGTLGGGIPAGDGIEFTVTGSEQKTSPKLARIAGLVFVNKSDPAAPPAVCKVTDAGRNLIVAADIAWNDKGMAISTPSGLRLKYPEVSGIVRLDFSHGKLIWLSDLDPSRAEVVLATEDNANFGKFVRYPRDRNLENGPLRLDGTAYAKGLGLHAGSVLVYDLSGDYAQFRCVLGVDESVQTESRVEVVVEGNGRELFRGTIGRRDSPRPISLDVKGVQQLRIAVRPTGLLELGGEVDLADAKISK